MEIQTSIIILSHHRPQLLSLCLQSIFQISNRNETEIILFFNGDHENYLEYLNLKFPEHKVKILYHDSVSNGMARNIAITHAQGSWICFLDDDTQIPSNYFQEAYRVIEHYPHVDVFGGPDRTNQNPTLYQKIIGLVQQSPLAMGPTFQRHISFGNNIVQANERILILCNLWIRRSLLGNKKGQYQFHPTIRRNEENILLASMNNLTLLYNPHLFVWHYKKTSAQSLITATISSGYNRAKSFFIAPSSFHFLFLIPAIFIMYLVLLLLIPSTFLGLPLAIYILAILIESIRNFLQEKTIPCFALTIILIPLIHIGYGAGIFIGLLQELKRNSQCPT